MKEKIRKLEKLQSDRLEKARELARIANDPTHDNIVLACTAKEFMAIDSNITEYAIALTKLFD